ncbi:hypothetical protein [Holospora curviuscula]|uniref:Uncharacterized protein n=1 Tax=Holospora curviuscula TaxID=1082868 RepID=A0A2S5R7L9_9PROT|nr:hypothetical protein [Holospora curviuscula]PPE03339.1 hypothetical protein HCUR_01221 [Holospora curviuscula]
MKLKHLRKSLIPVVLILRDIWMIGNIFFEWVPVVDFGGGFNVLHHRINFLGPSDGAFEVDLKISRIL